MASAVETHPQKQRIIDALLSGESPQSISKWCNPYISSVGIWRYRRKALQSVATAQAGVIKVLEDKGLILRDSATSEIAAEAVRDVTRAVIAADPVLARLNSRQVDRDSVLQEAREKGDLKAWSALDRNDLSAIELHAKLTGRLNTSDHSTNITIVIPDRAPARQVEEEGGAVIDLDPVP